MINIRQTKGGSKEYICAECGRSGDQLLMLRRHVIMCHSRFSCPYCDFKTVNKPALAQHVKRRHVYPCLEAGCSFSAESEAEMRLIFNDLDALIRTEPAVGDYDQTI